MERVPDGGLLGHTGENLPPKEKGELPQVGQTSGPELPEKRVCWPTPGPSQSEAPTLEANVLGKVHLLTYTEWDPEDK